MYSSFSPDITHLHKRTTLSPESTPHTRAWIDYLQYLKNSSLYQISFTHRYKRIKHTVLPLNLEIFSQVPLSFSLVVLFWFTTFDCQAHLKHFYYSLSIERVHKNYSINLLLKCNIQLVISTSNLNIIGLISTSDKTN